MWLRSCYNFFWSVVQHSLLHPAPALVCDPQLSDCTCVSWNKHSLLESLVSRQLPEMSQLDLSTACSGNRVLPGLFLLTLVVSTATLPDPKPPLGGSFSFWGTGSYYILGDWNLLHGPGWPRTLPPHISLLTREGGDQSFPC